MTKATADIQRLELAQKMLGTTNSLVSPPCCTTATRRERVSLLAIPLEVIPLTLLKSDHSIMNSGAEAAIHSERSIAVSIVQQTLESLHICTSIALG